MQHNNPTLTHCPRCGEALVKTILPQFDYVQYGKTTRFDDVAADECPNCKETWLAEETLQAMQDRLIQQHNIQLVTTDPKTGFTSSRSRIIGLFERAVAYVENEDYDALAQKFALLYWNASQKRGAARGQCETCRNGAMRHNILESHRQQHKEDEYLFHGVPALTCDHCGTTIIEEHILKLMDDILAIVYG